MTPNPVMDCGGLPDRSCRNMFWFSRHFLMFLKLWEDVDYIPRVDKHEVIHVMYLHFDLYIEFPKEDVGLLIE